MEQIGYYYETEEDKGVLDAAWEPQQTKAFTAWCNSHLRKQNVQIERIDEDFQDGLKLILLLEIITGERLPVPETGRLRCHLIANINEALDFISAKGVKLDGIGAEEITDGNLQVTLNLIWTIISRFAIQQITLEDFTAKEGLLLWCQRKTAPYKNVNVQNFHMSFKDGLAFCALLHMHRPDIVDYEKLSKDNPLENLNLAFDIAEKYFDIPRMLEAEDLVNMVKPDEKSIMAYVSSYYHALASSQSEAPAEKICKALKFNQETENLIEEYERIASSLVGWLGPTTEWLETGIQGNTLSAAIVMLEEYREYRDSKQPKTEEMARLFNVWDTLTIRHKLSGRSIYTPSEGKPLVDIYNAWTKLEAAEKSLKDSLMLRLQSDPSLLEQNEGLEIEFAQIANQLGETIERYGYRVTSIARQATGTSENKLQELQNVKEKIETFQSNFDELKKCNRELLEAKIFENQHTSYTHEELLVKWEHLLTLVSRRIQQVENQILIRDSRGLSEDQLKKIHSSFVYFDKNDNGYLDVKEFTQCLVSLGYSGVIIKRVLLEEGLVTEEGSVTYGSFIEFRTREMGDSDSAEKLSKSFRKLAGEKPYITASTLRRELPPDQAEFCISRMAPYTGPDAEPEALDYRAFSKTIYGENKL